MEALANNEEHVAMHKRGTAGYGIHLKVDTMLTPDTAITHLVVYLLLSQRQFNELLEMAILLLKLYTFCPIIECSRHVDLGGRVFPRSRLQMSVKLSS